MARAPTWSVKGIDQETRALAREAAARSDRSIGEWIDRAIRTSTGLPLESEAPAQGARPQPDGEAAAARPRPAPDADDSARRVAALAATSGRAWYAVAALLALALTGSGFWVLEKFGGGTAPESAAVKPHPAAPVTVAARSAATSPPVHPAAAEVESPMVRLNAEAKRGNPAAQYDLGVIYARGETTPRNDEVAARWFQAAAEQGLPAAQFNLGVFYEQGRGVPRDLARAFHWYQSAAEQGHARARHNLGTMLAEGKGTRRDYKKAAYWFTKAAEAGIAESYVSLGLLHEHGLGRAPDLATAAGFYRQAAAKGSEAAEERLASLSHAAKAAPKAPAAPPPETALDAKGIAELQRLLRQLKLSPGTPDGVLGHKTVAAIRMYQEFAGLPVDGKPTWGLLGDLRQVVGAMGGDGDKATPGS